MFLRVFPEALTIRTPTATKITETSIRGDSGCSDPMILDHHPVHPLNYEVMEGVQATLISIVGQANVSVWRETLSYFPELLTDRSQSTRGYALEDYPYTRSDDIQYSWISIRNGATAPSHNDMRGGYTLLHTAVVLNSYTSADALLQLQADVNATNESGYTPLALACEHGTFDVAELLLQYGADAATN
ncbi:MAG: ankyrin repeat domain-containing protein [Pseudidiomarina maritima]|nr:ankyrin repeat domain-containing protein [Pseudidiomarina maritima]